MTENHGPGRFGSVLTAMVTPFDQQGELDVDEAVRLAKWLVAQGNDGLVVTGTTGESPTLTHDEKITLWREVVKAVSIPVLAGSTTNNTEESVQLTKEATRAGIAGILAVTPYYNRPSQLGMTLHFAAIAQATDLPVVLYDIPFRTGRKIAHETFLHLLGSHNNIVGVKDAAGDVEASRKLIAETGASFELYCGEDKLTHQLLGMGARGVIGVASHWATEEFKAMNDAYWIGDRDLSAKYDGVLQASYAFESTDEAPNPVPTKAMMRTLGFSVGECRLPMGPTPDGLEAQARGVLSGLGKNTNI